MCFVKAKYIAHRVSRRVNYTDLLYWCYRLSRKLYKLCWTKGHTVHIDNKIIYNIYKYVSVRKLLVKCFVMLLPTIILLTFPFHVWRTVVRLSQLLVEDTFSSQCLQFLRRTRDRQRKPSLDPMSPQNGLLHGVQGTWNLRKYSEKAPWCFIYWVQTLLIDNLFNFVLEISEYEWRPVILSHFRCPFLIISIFRRND